MGTSAEVVKAVTGMVFKGMVDFNYRGTATFAKQPTEFTLAQVMLPWRKIQDEIVLYVADAALGTKFGVPLTATGVTSDQETANNLEFLLQQNNNGCQLTAEGSAVVRTSPSAYWLKLLGMAKENFMRREVYRGTISIEGGQCFSFYSDLSPQFRQISIRRE